MKLKNNKEIKNYLVQVESHLNIEQEKILNYFYQPLIGFSALSLYRFLLEEEHFLKSVNFNLKLNRIYQFLNLTSRDLKINLNILEKFDLLKIYSWNQKNKVEFDKILFYVKSPLSISHFLKSNLFEEFQSKVSDDVLEQIYFWLRPTQFLAFVDKKNIAILDSLKKESKQPVLKKEEPFHLSQIKKKGFDVKKQIADFLLSLECLQAVDYQPKVQDIQIIQKLWEEKVPSQIIKTILDFTVFKINNFSSKYFWKLIETLKEKSFLGDLGKTRAFFQNLYCEMTWDSYQLEIKKYFPSWLEKESSFQIKPKKMFQKNLFTAEKNAPNILDQKQFDEFF